MSVLEGTIKEILHYENSFGAIRVQLNEGVKRAAGNIINPVPGQKIIMEGEWTIHKRWGKQFKVVSAKTIQPETREGILNYLMSGFIKGIGPAMADKIYGRFGNDAITILEESPEKLIEIPGISQKKIEEIKLTHAKSKVYVELSSYLGEVATKYQIETIYKKYQDGSVEVLKENPYRLIYDIDGIGFIKADKLAMGCGISGNHPKRINAAIVYILQEIVSDGHCFLYEESLKNNLRLLLKMQIDPAVFKAELQKLVENGRIIIDDDAIYLAGIYDSECLCAEHVDRILTALPNRKVPELWVHDAILSIEAEHAIKLEVEQKLAINEAMRHNMLLLTGGPGTGKTTIISAILRSWKDRRSVLLAAPTGCAARRMAELTGYSAHTIHKALEYSFNDGKMSFRYNRENPWPYDLIIIDESTMPDVKIAASVFSAVRDGARLIMIGDVDQLPSIGAGNVFRDLLMSNRVPKVQLKACHRQSGSIGVNTQRINHGMGVHTLIQDDTFHYIPMVSAAEMQPVVIEQYVRLAKKYGTENVQCLTGVKEKSRVGTEELNELIRAQVNPINGRNGLKYGKKEFYVNDRVMQIVNDYEKGVFNGDMGIVRAINEIEKKMTVAFEDGRIIFFDHSDLKTLELCYAITIHKSLGSEYKATVIAHSLPPKMRQRNLTYTAVSRAKNEVVLIGDRYEIDASIGAVSPNTRNTRLKNRLTGEIKHGRPA